MNARQVLGFPDALIAHMEKEGAVILLGRIVQQIVEAGTYGGVEVGFFTTIGAAVAGVRLVE
jgi:hypothetical protein